MAERQTTRPQGDPPDRPFEAGTGGLDGTGASGSSAEVVLAMNDLIADEHGEIVFFNDSDLRRLVVKGDAVVVAEGRSAAHTTSAGEDVSGFSFVTFDTGVTLYYQPGLDLVVCNTSD
jgi:hypothetical protein